MSQKRIPILGALVVLIASMWLLTLQLNTAKRLAADATDRAPMGLISTTRQPLPAYRLADLAQQELPSDELSHGRVLLVFLTTSCAPCVEEVKIISRLYASHPANLRIYGVSFERPAQVATFGQEFDLKFPLRIDLNAQLAKSLDIHYFPSIYLIDDGVIVKTWRGVTRDEADFYQQLGTQ